MYKLLEYFACAHDGILQFTVVAPLDVPPQGPIKTEEDESNPSNNSSELVTVRQPRDGNMSDPGHGFVGGCGFFELLFPSCCFWENCQINADKDPS